MYYQLLVHISVILTAHAKMVMSKAEL